MMTSLITPGTASGGVDRGAQVPRAVPTRTLIDTSHRHKSRRRLPPTSLPILVLTIAILVQSCTAVESDTEIVLNVTSCVACTVNNVALSSNPGLLPPRSVMWCPPNGTANGATQAVCVIYPESNTSPIPNTHTPLRLPATCIPHAWECASGEQPSAGFGTVLGWGWFMAFIGLIAALVMSVRGKGMSRTRIRFRAMCLYWILYIIYHACLTIDVAVSGVTVSKDEAEAAGDSGLPSWLFPTSLLTGPILNMSIGGLCWIIEVLCRNSDELDAFTTEHVWWKDGYWLAGFISHTRMTTLTIAVSVWSCVWVLVPSCEQTGALTVWLYVMGVNTIPHKVMLYLLAPCLLMALAGVLAAVQPLYHLSKDAILGVIALYGDPDNVGDADADGGMPSGTAGVINQVGRVRKASRRQLYRPRMLLSSVIVRAISVACAPPMCMLAVTVGQYAMVKKLREISGQEFAFAALNTLYYSTLWLSIVGGIAVVLLTYPTLHFAHFIECALRKEQQLLFDSVVPALPINVQSSVIRRQRRAQGANGKDNDDQGEEDVSVVPQTRQGNLYQRAHTTRHILAGMQAVSPFLSFIALLVTGLGVFTTTPTGLETWASRTSVGGYTQHHKLARYALHGMRIVFYMMLVPCALYLASCLLQQYSFAAPGNTRASEDESVIAAPKGWGKRIQLWHVQQTLTLISHGGTVLVTSVGFATHRFPDDVHVFVIATMVMSTLGLMTTCATFFARLQPLVKFFPTDDSFRVSILLKSLMLAVKAQVILISPSGYDFTFLFLFCLSLIVLAIVTFVNAVQAWPRAYVFDDLRFPKVLVLGFVVSYLYVKATSSYLVIQAFLWSRSNHDSDFFVDDADIRMTALLSTIVLLFAYVNNEASRYMLGRLRKIGGTAPARPTTDIDEQGGDATPLRHATPIGVTRACGGMQYVILFTPLVAGITTSVGIWDFMRFPAAGPSWAIVALSIPVSVLVLFAVREDSLPTFLFDCSKAPRGATEKAALLAK